MPAFNRAFRFGDGLFETILIRAGQPACWSQHLARLAKGMQALGLQAPEDAAAWHARLADEVAAQWKQAGRPAFARARLHVYRDGGGAYLPETDQAVAAVEVAAYPGDPWLQAQPAPLCWWPEGALSLTPWSGCKTSNALPYILASRYARAQGASDALIAGPGGQLAEAAASNVLICAGGRWHTPWLASGRLDGILLRRVLEAMARLGMPCEERRIAAEETRHCESLWLCNTQRGLYPARSLDGRPLDLSEVSLVRVREAIRQMPA
ncbi:MAG: aminotransferase class IV [Bacteroidia bacterium]|nr:aminotransferase class IV [Bacteroidia bacterium]